MRVFKKVGVALSACVALGVVSAPAHAEIGPGADPETLTAAPLSTWQTNGTVWDMAVVNGVVYIGGNFTSVRPPGAAPGTGEVTRRRLAAFNASTGALLSWNPSATSTPFTSAGTPDSNCTQLTTGQTECATVWSIVATPDNRSIVVGGDFQAINGSARGGVAAFSVTTGTLSVTTPGTLNATFRPSVSGRISSVAATNTGVWIGGSVTRANGQTRTGLAAFAFPSGTLSTAFNPTVVRGAPERDNPTGVRKIVVTADGRRLIVGGGFASISGRAIHGLQAIDAVNGAPAQWDSNRIINAAYVTNLKIYGSVLYSNGEAAGTTSEGLIAFDAATGAELWYDGCRGASHSMALARGVAYVGSHSHDCGAAEGGYPEQYNGYPEGDRRRYTLRAVVPNGVGAKLLPWTPRTNDGNGARDMEFDGTNLWVAGEFTTVDQVAQQGLTRFGFLANGASNHRPLTPSAPIATSNRSGVVDISFQETEDPDNRRLTYQLYRDGNTSNPIYTTTGSNPPWLKGWMQFQDTVAPGSTHTYDVRAIDPLGVQSNRSAQASIRAASASTSLANLARTDGAAKQFSFESRVSGSYVDGIGGQTALAGSGATDGIGNGVSGNAMDVTGSTGGAAVVQTREWTTRQFSVETMFKTTSTQGGSLVSFGSSSNTTSAGFSSVGNLYMDNTGRLNFGLRPAADRGGDPWSGPVSQRRAVTTSGSYTDGAWHHVVATFQPGTGSRIFVDGTLAAEDPTMVWTMPLEGYMRMGGDSTNGFPNAPTSSWFAGTLDEVALYRYPLSARQVTAHSNVVSQTTPTEPDPIQVVASGSVWKYDVSGAPAAGWFTAAHNDAAWPSGPSQLGHGEDDEATAITPFMPNGTTRRITTYFRTSFDLPASPAVTGLSLRMKLDDGVILYLNGQQVLRDNMPTGTVGPETLSTTWAADDGLNWRTVTIPTAALVGGRNVLAAEVHQNARSSLDLTWDAELTARFN